MKINEKRMTIELTKVEMKNAMVVGSPTYKMLQQARRDYPGFKTVEIKSKQSKSDFGNLKMKTIQAYVQKYGTEEQKTTLTFLCERTITENGEYHEAQSFFKIKEWFLNEFPEIKNTRKSYREKVNNIYKAAKDKAVAEDKTEKVA